MKRLLTLTGLLTGVAALLSAQEIQSDAPPFANWPVVQYRINDPVAKQLDYANTVCDTLLYNGQVILLDESPLLQLDGVKELVQQYQTPLPDDSIYNCQRGYTARWEIIDNQIYLVGLAPFKGNDRLWAELSKLNALKPLRKKPIPARWVCDTLKGGAGADAVKTNYGYAFKQIYRFPVEAGTKKEEIRLELPTGTLEDKERLTAFLQQHRDILYEAYLDAQFIHQMHERGGDENTRFLNEIPLMSDIQGESYYLLPTWNELSLRAVCLGESTIARKRRLSEVSLANTFPRGSFYPRFLRTGFVYQPTYVQYLYTFLYPDISNAEFIYYTPQKNKYKNDPLLKFPQ